MDSYRARLAPELSKTLKKLRYTSEKTVHEVAKDTGISASTISRLETGKTLYISKKTLSILEKYYDISLLPLFDDTDKDAKIDELYERIRKLEKENECLKWLLQSKWRKESNDN